MHDLALSRHALTRANQRGITHQLIRDLLELADVEEPVGGGCTVLRLSRRQLRDRDLRARLGSRADRLQNIALVWSAEGEIVTVVHDHGGRAGRRYRPVH